MNHSPHHQTDVLVIGAGAAGLSVAIRLAAQRQVTLVLKDNLPGGASYWAQGGIAVVVDKSDSLAQHAIDTIRVGAGLCHEEVVRYVVEQAPEQLAWLLAQGVRFTEETDENGQTQLHLTREGGHSARRIVHADDATGAVVQTCLVAIAKQLPNLTILTRRIAVDLICGPENASVPMPQRCSGAYIYNESEQRVETWSSQATVLATGGASRAWLHSTNPDAASGDGIAMGWRVGCRVANLEFNQFHPTCLFLGEKDPQSRRFLLTEALRGEGAYLRRGDGTRFMFDYHPEGELAPRDIVARAIDSEMKKQGTDHVYLDISHRPADFIRAHFPTVYAHCFKAGIDLTIEPAPIVPAAHYTCGGLVTNLEGQTDIPGLYAVGEVACTGLHGANRIASNSLLECFVLGAAAAKHILAQLPGIPQKIVPTWKNPQVSMSQKEDEAYLTSQLQRLRQIMSHSAGIVRNTALLRQALEEIKLLTPHHYPLSRQGLELRNLVQVSTLIVRSALQRTESRGLHFLEDYPEQDAQQVQDTVLIPPSLQDMSAK